MGLYRGKILLNEGSRDNMLKVYLPYFEQAGINMNLSQLKQFLLNKFVTEAGIHNLSESSNYYLAGVARYYFNGDLTLNKKLNAFYPNQRDEFNEEICKRLDTLIGILRMAYIDSVGTKFEQPEDFGELSIRKLLRKYGKKIDTELGIEKSKDEEENTQVQQNDNSAGSNYTYEILYSYDDAKKYNSYTEPGAWCITYGKQHYDGYIKRLGIHYVIFRMNGFENVKREKTQGFSYRKPHDLYGNSLIAVLQSNETGEPIYITSRWNHGSSYDGTSGTEADHAYTKQEFLNVIGCDDSILKKAFNEWKAVKAKNKGPSRKEANLKKLTALRAFKMAQMRMNNGVEVISALNEFGTNARIGNISDNTQIKKGDFIITMMVNGEYYTTIMSRGVMQMDNFFIQGFVFCNSIRNNANNRMMRLRHNNTNHCWIYDKTKHTILSLDGVKNFIDVVEVGFTSPYSYVAATTNQIALMNMQTGEPVTAPNGAVWFESIIKWRDNYRAIRGNRDYSGRLWIPFTNEDDVLRLAYDTSANEIYAYDLKNNRFIENEEGSLMLSTSQPFINNTVSVPILQRLMVYFDDNGYYYKNIDTGEFIKFGNTECFGFISGDFNGIIKFSDADDVNEVMFYDTGINKVIEINGEPLKVHWNTDDMNIYYITKCGKSTGENWKDYIFIKTSDTSKGTYYIYNTLVHDFYRERDGNYIFKVNFSVFYKDNVRRITYIVDIDGHDVHIILPDSNKMPRWHTNESKTGKSIIIPESKILKLKGI